MQIYFLIYRFDIGLWRTSDLIIDQDSYYTFLVRVPYS